VAAHSAGTYTATLLVIVNAMKGGGRAPPPPPAWANFTLMIKCTPESSRCYSVYSVEETISPTFHPVLCLAVLLCLLVGVPVFLLPVGEDKIRSVPKDQFRPVARLQQLNAQLLRLSFFLSNGGQFDK
jgi:hypothetical protein